MSLKTCVCPRAGARGHVLRRLEAQHELGLQGSQAGHSTPHHLESPVRSAVPHSQQPHPHAARRQERLLRYTILPWWKVCGLGHALCVCQSHHLMVCLSVSSPHGLSVSFMCVSLITSWSVCQYRVCQSHHLTVCLSVSCVSVSSPHGLSVSLITSWSVC